MDEEEALSCQVVILDESDRKRWQSHSPQPMPTSKHRIEEKKTPVLPTELDLVSRMFSSSAEYGIFHPPSPESGTQTVTLPSHHHVEKKTLSPCPTIIIILCILRLGDICIFHFPTAPCVIPQPQPHYHHSHQC